MECQRSSSRNFPFWIPAIKKDTPKRMNDWDSTQTPSLVNGPVAGQSRKMVVLANRNGFYYALDRVSGKFITGQPYVKQTWATGLDETGRPMRVPGVEPTVEGKLIWPAWAAVQTGTARRTVRKRICITST
jgi:glucose dehydrogenase